MRNERVYGKLNPKSRFCLWIKIVTDPFVRYRGFSLLSREFIVFNSKPVKHTVMCTIDRKKMSGIFYPVAEEEWLRVVPEMHNSPHRSRYWFVPIEFCLKFIRPIYNRPSSYKSYGLENESWYKPKVSTFGKYYDMNKEIPRGARIAAENAHRAGLR